MMSAGNLHERVERLHKLFMLHMHRLPVEQRLRRWIDLEQALVEALRRREAKGEQP
jgi:hypothetical protein